MVANPAFRVHGIWSKILSIFIKNHESASIVTYSDNRLFTGGVYQKMNMFFDGEVKPDYDWIKGSKRFNKSHLRKHSESEISETTLRESQGYRKIWNHGRKRWILEKRKVI
jgi:hypothetical protein